MKKVKNAIAYVIYSENRAQVLTVLRPESDKELPNMWGLPAGSLKDGESFEQAVVRSGKEKLGVDLKVVQLISEGDIEREEYVLHMKEYEAEIVDGEPSVPQKIENITQYSDCKWAEPGVLVEAAKKGSLCAQLFLTRLGIEW